MLADTILITDDAPEVLTSAPRKCVFDSRTSLLMCRVSLRRYDDVSYTIGGDDDASAAEEKKGDADNDVDMGALLLALFASLFVSLHSGANRRWARQADTQRRRAVGRRGRAHSVKPRRPRAQEA